MLAGASKNSCFRVHTRALQMRAHARARKLRKTLGENMQTHTSRGVVAADFRNNESAATQTHSNIYIRIRTESISMTQVGQWKKKQRKSANHPPNTIAGYALCLCGVCVVCELLQT